MSSIVILGPSDRSEVSAMVGTGYDRWLRDLAATTLTFYDEVIFMPDDGVYVDFAIAFKALGGKITAIIPSEEQEFIVKAQNYTENYRTFPNATGWSYLNTHLVGLGSAALCVGYSAGSILEIASIKYIEKYDNTLIRLYVDRRVVSTDLPHEFARELKSVDYFTTDIEYEKLLQRDAKGATS